MGYPIWASIGSWHFELTTHLCPVGEYPTTEIEILARRDSFLKAYLDSHAFFDVAGEGARHEGRSRRPGGGGYDSATSMGPRRGLFLGVFDRVHFRRIVLLISLSNRSLRSVISCDRLDRAALR